MTKILVLDDEPHVVETLVCMLGDRFDVVGVTDAHLALDLISGGGIDLLVTDVVMPVMDGFCVSKEARRRKPRLPIVFISAYIDDRDPFERRRLDQYADAALTKPFNTAELMTTLARISRRTVPTTTSSGAPPVRGG